VPAHPLGLRRQSRRTVAGQPVVAAHPAVDDLLSVFGDQALVLEAVESGVQGAGAKANLAVRDALQVGDDPVSVLWAGS
jgi:hypothetical protein